MPLILPRTHRVRTLRHICRLQEPNPDVLLGYARFIGDCANRAHTHVKGAPTGRYVGSLLRDRVPPHRV